MSTVDLLPVPGSPPPVTNLLAMPELAISIETANNEDWIDSIVYLLNSTDPSAPQLDIRGIRFEMEIRRAIPNHEVVIHASTDDGMLATGAPPNFGYLLINIPHEIMKVMTDGDYVGDVVGTDEFVTRRVISITLTIDEGITRP